ncbi:unnamed protein product, partial [Lampetra planeri]
IAVVLTAPRANLYPTTTTTPTPEGRHGTRGGWVASNHARPPLSPQCRYFNTS